MVGWTLSPKAGRWSDALTMEFERPRQPPLRARALATVGSAHDSHNRRKAIRRLWRHQARMANLRRDVLHKLTTEIVRRAASIGIEALTDVFKNGWVFRAIAELGVYKFRRQPEYLRPGEVADLRLDDIDWRGGTIEVRTHRSLDTTRSTPSWICRRCTGSRSPGPEVLR